jgi:hypothetical protein
MGLPNATPAGRFRPSPPSDFLATTMVQGEYQINKRWSVNVARDQLGGFSGRRKIPLSILKAFRLPTQTTTSHAIHMSDRKLTHLR